MTAKIRKWCRLEWQKHWVSVAAEFERIKCKLGWRAFVMSECTALLGQKSGFQGVLDSGFSSCSVPTYYFRSEYFYNQCPKVWNLIRTECSLNRSEHRVKSKAS